MASGKARRARIAGLDGLATVIESLKKIEAIAIGRMRPKLGDKVIGDDVGIVVKNSEATANRDAVGCAIAIARTATNFVFEPDQPAPCLLDHDAKMMPPTVAEKLTAAGGFWPALVGACPGFANAGRLVRNSTSAGLSRSDTGEKFPSSGGLHTYVLVRDGADIERFLADLEGRCWLAGLGWIALSAAGSYLVRSIIDVTVGAPERLCFEAPAIIEAPLAQDPVARRPVVHPGDAIDSFAVCPPLTSFERAEVRRLQDNGRRALADERNRILVARAGKLATQRGITVDAARRIVDDQCRGILASELVLEFDDPEIARTTTVADLLDDPAKYEGQISRRSERRNLVRTRQGKGDDRRRGHAVDSQLCPWSDDLSAPVFRRGGEGEDRTRNRRRRRGVHQPRAARQARQDRTRRPDRPRCRASPAQGDSDQGRGRSSPEGAGAAPKGGRAGEASGRAQRSPADPAATVADGAADGGDGEDQRRDRRRSPRTTAATRPRGPCRQDPLADDPRDPRLRRRRRRRQDAGKMDDRAAQRVRADRGNREIHQLRRWRRRAGPPADAVRKGVYDARRPRPRHPRGDSDRANRSRRRRSPRRAERVRSHARHSVHHPRRGFGGGPAARRPDRCGNCHGDELPHRRMARRRRGRLRGQV